MSLLGWAGVPVPHSPQGPREPTDPVWIQSSWAEYYCVDGSVESAHFQPCVWHLGKRDREKDRFRRPEGLLVAADI